MGWHVRKASYKSLRYECRFRCIVIVIIVIVIPDKYFSHQMRFSLASILLLIGLLDVHLTCRCQAEVYSVLAAWSASRAARLGRQPSNAPSPESSPANSPIASSLGPCFAVDRQPSAREPCLRLRQRTGASLH